MMRAIFIKRLGLMALLLVLHVAAIAAPGGERQIEQQIEQQIYELINEYREQNGLPPLQYNKDVADMAHYHSRRMADKDVPFGHTGFQDRYNVLKRELPDMTAGAENVAYGADDAAEAVALWLRSAGHKKNIQGNFTHTGISVVRDSDGRLYFTQLFVKVQ